MLEDRGLAGAGLPDDCRTKDPVFVAQPDFFTRLGVDAETDVAGVRCVAYEASIRGCD